MEWYLDQKEITDENKINRNIFKMNQLNKNISFLYRNDVNALSPPETHSTIPQSSPIKVVYPNYSKINVGNGIIRPKNFFSPYVDASAWPPLQIATISKDFKMPYFNLGFIVSRSSSVCEPTWGTYYSIDECPLNDQIKEIRSMGGDILVSFGGFANIPLHVTAPDENVLKEQYLRLINAYGLTTIDFDIEGKWINDIRSLKRNSKALKLLQKDLPNIDIWFTLPTLPTGLTEAGINVIKFALEEKVDLRGVNLMTMDYTSSVAPNPQDRMAEYGIQAITSVFYQLKKVYSHYGITKSYPQFWNMIGTTPMIGVNDVKSEIFNLNDANQTLSFAKKKSLGMISMWSLNRDKECPFGSQEYVSMSCSSIPQKDYQFSKILNQFNYTYDLN